MALRLIIDSREQLPFDFSRYDVEKEVKSLPIGDYSIPGFEDRVAVESNSI